MKRSTIIFFFIMVFLPLKPSLAQTFSPEYSVGPEMNVARMAHLAVEIPGNKVLLLGGHGTGFVSLGSAEVFSTNPDTFVLKNMNYVHDGGAAAKLEDGRVLIMGGAANSGVAPGYNTAEIYDPIEGTFTSTGSMNYARCNVSAATLKNGKVLVVGGWFDVNSATYAELYDPSSGTFSVAGTMNNLRSNPIVIPTNDTGAVILSGIPIYGGNYYESVEYYNSKTGTISVFRERLFDSEGGWLPIGYSFYNRVIESQRLPNGKYVLLAQKNMVDSVAYTLFTVDPETKAFERIVTDKHLPSIKETNYSYYYAPIVDAKNLVVYLPVVYHNPTIQKIQLIVVDLKNNTVVEQEQSFVLPTNYYLGGLVFNLLPDGRILMSGGHTQWGYNTNFSPHTHTFFIKPNYEYNTTSVSIDTDILPKVITLKQNYPNPFNPMTTIEFTLTRDGFTTLKVYDLFGREVATLLSRYEKAGAHKVDFNASTLASGVYFYRLQFSTFVEVKKLIVLK